LTIKDWFHEFQTSRNRNVLKDKLQGLDNYPDCTGASIVPVPTSIYDAKGYTNPVKQTQPIYSNFDAPEDLYQLAVQAIEHAVQSCTTKLEEGKPLPYYSRPEHIGALITNGAFSKAQYDRLVQLVEKAAHDIQCAELRINLTNRIMGIDGLTDAQMAQSMWMQNMVQGAGLQNMYLEEQKKKYKDKLTGAMTKQQAKP